jgi:hypothetical protein
VTLPSNFLEFRHWVTTTEALEKPEQLLIREMGGGFWSA